MDEQKLREREALEDAQLAEDKKKAAGKLAAVRRGSGLGPTPLTRAG